MKKVAFLPLTVLVVGLGAAAGITPSQAAPRLTPVAGALHQTFRSVPAVAPGKPQVVPHRTYYFNGTATDQATKIAGSPTATFSTAKPTGASDIVQESFGAGGSAGPGSKTAPFWTAPLTASIDGPVTVHWWWETVNALSTLGGSNATVEVWADPGTPTQKLIGSAGVTIDPVGNSPVEITSTLRVTGKVTKTLMVQVRPIYSDASEDLRVYYGSAAHPSSFDVPTVRVPPVKIPSTIPLKGGQPLLAASTYIGRKASEPTMGVTNAGNAFIVAAAFDGLSPATPQTKVYGSYDGNRSWRDISPTVAGRSFPPTTLDPYIYVDPITGRVFDDDLTVGCSVLIYSDDQGKTWSKGNPFACEAPVDDHQTLAAGPFPQSLTSLKTSYPNIVYYCINKVGDSQCARSFDGGDTFTFTGSPAFTGADPAAGVGVCGGLFGHIVTDKRGRLYMPKGHCGKPWLSVSEDGGTTWRRTLVSPTIGAAGIQTSVAVDAAGNVYYVWWDNFYKLPYMAVSRDAGVTFSKPVLIAPPGVQAVNFPDVSAGPRGEIAVSFPGTTSADTADAWRPWNYYVLSSVDALDPQPVFTSTTVQSPKDPIHRGACLSRCAGMYDFLDVKMTPTGSIWASAVDTCTGNCVTTSEGKVPSGGVAPDAQGVVIRILSGPKLPTVKT